MKEAGFCDLKPSLVFAIIKAESKFDANAKSSAGAVGLMQIRPSTASYVETMISKNTENAAHQNNPISSFFSLHQTNEEFEKTLFDPKTNIKLGTRYLKYLIDKFQVLNTAICAYNAGETVVKTWLENNEYSFDGKSLKKIPFAETDRYLKKVKLVASPLAIHFKNLFYLEEKFYQA